MLGLGLQHGRDRRRATGGATGTSTDPATGTSVPPSTCACPAGDPSCVCDALGNCKGQTCEGQCVPVEADVRPEQAEGLPDVRAGLPGRRHADPVGRRSEHLLPDVHLPDVRPLDAGVDDGRNRHRLPGDPLPVRQAGRHRPGQLLPEVRVRPGQRRRDLRVAEQTPLPNPLPASRGEGT